MKEIIISNLKEVQDRIKNACELSGRNASEVQLLLATKTVPFEKIKMAIDIGFYRMKNDSWYEVKK